MGISWVHHGYIMGITWVYHGYIMGITWVYHGYNMGISWVHNGLIRYQGCTNNYASLSNRYYIVTMVTYHVLPITCYLTRDLWL